MRHLIACASPALLAALVTGCVEARLTVDEAVASINEEDYIRKLSVIADDSMMGRDTPSEGLEKTAAWIADEFERYGLLPGGEDGTYIQRWPYPGYAVDLEATSVLVEGGPALTLGEEIAYFGRPADAEASGEVVVVAGSEGGTQAMGSIEIAGKHVLFFPGSSRIAQLATRGFRGAASVFSVVEADDEEWARTVERQRSNVIRVYGGEPPEFDGSPTFMIRSEAALALLEAGGASAPDPAGALRAIPLSGVSMTVTSASRQVDGAMPPNVIGILPGSDPELSDEYVIFSGHMDHIGTRARPQPDSVFDENGSFVRMETDTIANGADDDGSGTIAVVEVAEAMSRLADPPARSMVFLLVSGEERGLLGSRWYAQNPTVPIERIVANFNTDMVGRNWSDTVVVIGKEHSELGMIMNRIGQEHPELNMAPIDDRWPDENFYRRSDHFNFARRGVPVLFFFSGTHEDYHQVTDEVRKIDGEKAARIARLVFYLGLEIGNAAQPPQWYADSYEEYVTNAPEGSVPRTIPRPSGEEGGS